MTLADRVQEYLGRMQQRGVTQGIAYARLLSAGLRAVEDTPTAPDPILRRPLYQAIQEILEQTPGLSTTEISQRLDLRSAAQARYYLRQLEEEGLVRREGKIGATRYYPAAHPVDSER